MGIFRDFLELLTELVQVRSSIPIRTEEVELFPWLKILRDASGMLLGFLFVEMIRWLMTIDALPLPWIIVNFPLVLFSVDHCYCLSVNNGKSNVNFSLIRLSVHFIRPLSIKYFDINTIPQDSLGFSEILWVPISFYGIIPIFIRFRLIFEKDEFFK